MAKVDEPRMGFGESSEAPTEPAWGEAAFTWGAWLLLLFAALLFTIHFAPEAPVCDDWWTTIPIVTGARPFDLPFLWSCTNEHRLPLPKLVVIPLVYLTGGVFWAENVLNVLTLGALAAALIATAARLRGRTSFTDAIFPLALLHLGHADLFVYRLTFNHVLATVFCCALMMAVARQERGLTWRTLLGIGIFLLFFPWCGANGLPAALAGAVWLALGSWWQPADGDARRRAFVARGLSLAVVCWVGAYFIGYKAPRHFPRPESVLVLLEGSVKVLGRSAIPYQGGAVFWVGLLLTALLAVTAAILARAALREPERRWRAIGLLLFLGAAATTALGIAWGRASSGEMTSLSRYAVVTVPAALGCYLAWVVMGPRRGRGLVQVGLFALFAFTFGFQTLDGLRAGQWMSQQSQAFLRELKAGAPSECLAQRYGDLLFPAGVAPSTELQIKELRRLQIGPFQGCQEPEYQIEEVALTPAAVHESTWDGVGGDAQGPTPYLVFSLEQPRHVQAIRLRFSLTRPGSEGGAIQVFWKGPEQAFDAYHRQERVTLLPGPAKEKGFVWVDGVIDQVRIAYDAPPCRLTVHEIALFYRTSAEGIWAEAPARIGATIPNVRAE